MQKISPFLYGYTSTFFVLPHIKCLKSGLSVNNDISQVTPLLQYTNKAD